MNTLGERLTQAERILGLKKKALAEQLRITPEWYSKITNGAVEGSSDIGLRLDDLLRRRGIDLTSSHHLNSGEMPARIVEPKAAHSGAVALRIPERRAPSTRIDCEDYIRRYLDAAEGDGDPDNFPAIMARLKKQFPLDEWAPAPEKK